MGFFFALCMTLETIVFFGSTIGVFYFYFVNRNMKYALWMSFAAGITGMALVTNIFKMWDSIIGAIVRNCA